MMSVFAEKFQGKSTHFQPVETSRAEWEQYLDKEDVRKSRAGVWKSLASIVLGAVLLSSPVGHAVELFTDVVATAHKYTQAQETALRARDQDPGNTVLRTLGNVPKAFGSPFKT